MSQLLAANPFGPRDDATLLKEMNRLTSHHWKGCDAFRKIWPEWRASQSLADLPYLHVQLFKKIALITQGEDIVHGRVLRSSSTSGSAPSEIRLDAKSSDLQARSVHAIHEATLGGSSRALLILDDIRALRETGLSARLAAAMSLLPLATERHFLLEDVAQPASVSWSTLGDVLSRQSEVIIYGSTWQLWEAWSQKGFPSDLDSLLKRVRVDYVHSGGWKKLESLHINQTRFTDTLLKRGAPRSQIVDYYGLSEQTGLLFPLCAKGYRHAPVWSEVLVRDPYTLEPVVGQPGLLQFMNPLAWGAPYHNVLTEDQGMRTEGPCPCGFKGRHFTLLGRLPRAEVRGCGNV